MSDPDFDAILNELEKMRNREKEILNFFEVTEVKTEYRARHTYGYELQISELDTLRGRISRAQTELIAKVLTDVRQATRDTSTSVTALNSSVTALNSSVTKLHDSSRRLESFTVMLVALTIVLLIATGFSMGLQLSTLSLPIWWERWVLALVPITAVIIFLTVIFPKLRKMTEVSPN